MSAQTIPAPSSVQALPTPPGPTARTERHWARFWLGFFMMWNLERYPWFVRFTKPFFTAMAWRTSAYLRSSLLANARRLLGPQSTDAEQAVLARRVMSNFYDFICDIGSGARTRENSLASSIDSIEGRERYLQVRSLRRGAILVTAHLGSFETGVAALRRDEPRVHIVFRRDLMNRFERLRSEQRRRLGVIEAAVDDGLAVWVKLRDALFNNDVVLMQGDRVMPGQPGERVPFLGGHMLVPNGPVKLSMATGAPLVPIFAPRMPNGKVRIILEQPIHVDLHATQERVPNRGHLRSASRARREPHPAVLQLTSVIERYVRAYPDQWLMVHRALCEDQLGAAER